MLRGEHYLEGLLEFELAIVHQGHRDAVLRLIGAENELSIDRLVVGLSRRRTIGGGELDTDLALWRRAERRHERQVVFALLSGRPGDRKRREVDVVVLDGPNPHVVVRVGRGQVCVHEGQPERLCRLDCLVVQNLHRDSLGSCAGSERQRPADAGVVLRVGGGDVIRGVSRGHDPATGTAQGHFENERSHVLHAFIARYADDRWIVVVENVPGTGVPQQFKVGRVLNPEDDGLAVLVDGVVENRHRYGLGIVVADREGFAATHSRVVHTVRRRAGVCVYPVGERRFLSPVAARPVDHEFQVAVALVCPESGTFILRAGSRPEHCCQSRQEEVRRRPTAPGLTQVARIAHLRAVPLSFPKR